MRTLVISSVMFQFLAEVPVESFVVESNTDSKDFVAYLESDFNFIENSRVFEGAKSGLKSNELVEPVVIMYKSLEVIIKSR
jgi:hypothetical protein